jgi:hypothetical protein
MVLLDKYKVLDITAWSLIFLKVVNHFKKGCWVVLHLCSASWGGCDIFGCNYTCGWHSARAGNFFALAVHCCLTMLVGRFSEVH